MDRDANDRRGSRGRSREQRVALGAGLGMIFGAALGAIGTGLVLGAALGLVSGGSKKDDGA